MWKYPLGHQKKILKMDDKLHWNRFGNVPLFWLDFLFRSRVLLYVGKEIEIGEKNKEDGGVGNQDLKIVITADSLNEKSPLAWFLGSRSQSREGGGRGWRRTQTGSFGDGWGTWAILELEDLFLLYCFRCDLIWSPGDKWQQKKKLNTKLMKGLVFSTRGKVIWSFDILTTRRKWSEK